MLERIINKAFYTVTFIASADFFKRKPSPIRMQFRTDLSISKLLSLLLF